jgi:starch synthase
VPKSRRKADTADKEGTRTQRKAPGTGRRGSRKPSTETAPAPDSVAPVEPQAAGPIPPVVAEPPAVTALGGEATVAESVRQLHPGLAVSEEAAELATPAAPTAAAQREEPPASGDLIGPRGGGGEPLSILMVASEALPFAKSGGLADVTGSLPLALARQGHSVTLVMPRYRAIEASGEPAHQVTVNMGRVRIETRFFERQLAERARVVFVDSPDLFDREHLYGGEEEYPDNAGRFGFLARAALEYAVAAGLRPDIIHAHDWQAGLVPVYRRTHYADHPAFERAATVFTVHNAAYQGLYPSDWLPELGLPWELYSIEGLEYWLNVSFLKAGIVFSDKIATVSPSYAKEIVRPGTGFGFEGLFYSRRDDLVGILNGIDTDAWDPAKDTHLPARYDAHALSGKRACKRALLEHYGLPADEAALKRPLVAMISRMVDQKGLGLIAALAADLPDFGATFVAMGEGESRHREMWQRLVAGFPDRFAVEAGYDEGRAHLIQAGADIFMMPSRYEPCGLSQMYSQRYGTVPVVHATGGLVDTVEPADRRTGEGTGFVFGDYTPTGLARALRDAIDTSANETVWRRLQANGMAKDFSWDASARQYASLYREARQVAGDRHVAVSVRR